MLTQRFPSAGALKSLSLTFQICEQCSGLTNNHLSSYNFMLASSLELQKKKGSLNSDMLRLLTWKCSYSVLPIPSVEDMHIKSLSQTLNGSEESQIVPIDYTGSKGDLHFLPELPWRLPRAGEDKQVLGAWRPLEGDSFAYKEAIRALGNILAHPRCLTQVPWSCSGGQTGYPRTPQMA